MSIRLDPRRLSALKQIAGERGLRPGELVTSWVEEQIDAARGVPAAAPVAQTAGTSAETAQALAQLTSRLDALAERVNALAAAPRQGAMPEETQAVTTSATPEVEAPVKKRRGRPPKNAQAAASTQGNGNGRRKSRGNGNGRGKGRRVPLHQAIISVINEHGPLAAVDIASAILREGMYEAPRSDKPLDAATVNSRVSNPVYRSLFEREDGRIGLAGRRDEPATAS